MRRREFIKGAAGLFVPAIPALILPKVAQAQLAGGLMFPGPGTAHSTGGAFTPPSIPNIIGWYPAGTGTIKTGSTAAVNGDNVTKQNDASGAGNHLVNSSGAGPVYNTTGLNGHPALSFDSSLNKALWTTVDSVVLPNVGTKMSCFCVINVNTAMLNVEAVIGVYLGNAQAAHYNNAASAALLQIDHQNTGVNQVSARNNFNFLADTATTFGTNIQLGMVYDGTNWKLYIGGVLQTTTANSGATFTSLGTIGMAGYPTVAGLQAFIADMVVVNDAISSTNISNLTSYWTGVYGV